MQVTRITSGQNNLKGQPSFKSVNVVLLNKRMFRNPENLDFVQEFFGLAVNQVKPLINVTAEKPKKTKIKLFKSKEDPKNLLFAWFLEQPLYSGMIKKLKENGGYSLNWLSQNINMPIREPLSKNHHSFFVFTQEQKDMIYKIFEKKNINNLKKKVKQEYIEKQIKGDASIKNPAWFVAKINDEMLEQLGLKIKDEHVNIFTCDTVDNVFSSLMKIDT